VSIPKIPARTVVFAIVVGLLWWTDSPYITPVACLGWIFIACAGDIIDEVGRRNW